MGTKQDKWFERLKGIAEKSDRKKQIEVGQTGTKDIAKLISDIQTYQIELEIQNEELRRSQTELKNSQDRFCKLFDFAPIGYIVLDQNGFVIDANNTISIMLGSKSDAIINKPFSQFVYPEDQTIFLAGFKSFYKNSINKTLEVRLKGQDNTSLFSRIEGRFVEFNDSFSDTVTERLLLNVTDISETKKAELALRKSEAEHRNFLNSLNDAVICSNMDGEIIFFNSCAESLFDCNAEDVLGTNVSRFCPDDLIDEQQQLIHKVLDKGLVEAVKVERLKFDGTRLPVEMSLHLNVDDHGRPQGFNAVIRDISEGIRQEELIRSAQEKLKYILDSLPDMILEVDSDMKVLWANKSALDLNPDAIGQSCHEAFPGNAEICDGCFCAKAFKTKNLETGIMYQPASKTAGESYWENLGIPLNNKNGKEMTVLEVSRNVTARLKAEKEKEKLISQLESALKDVKQLSGLLPICSHCKKIRDDNGYWKQIESYLYEHSEAKFSHSICRDCAKKYYPDMDIYEAE